jgi:hypothetical protein
MYYYLWCHYTLWKFEWTREIDPAVAKIAIYVKIFQANTYFLEFEITFSGPSLDWRWLGRAFGARA